MVTSAGEEFETPGSSRACPVDGCPGRGPSYFSTSFCYFHWNLIPTHLRSRITGIRRNTLAPVELLTKAALAYIEYRERENDLNKMGAPWAREGTKVATW